MAEVEPTAAGGLSDVAGAGAEGANARGADDDGIAEAIGSTTTPLRAGAAETAESEAEG